MATPIEEAIAALQIGHAKQRRDIADIQGLTGRPASDPKVYTFTTVNPSRSLVIGNCRSFTIVNLSPLNIYADLLGLNADQDGPGIRIPGNYFTTFPWGAKNLELQIGVAPSSINQIAGQPRGSIQALVISHPDERPFASAPIAYGPGSAEYTRVTIAAPSAGADWSYTIPASIWARLLSGFTTLTTSSTVANRYAGIIESDANGVEIGELQVATAITASLVERISYGHSSQWATIAASPAGTVAVQAVFPSFPIPPGYTIGSKTVGLAAGDQYSSIQLLFEEWTAAPLLDSPGTGLT
ncbi:MAG TPA: hypothetical protein VG348_15765 [Acidimicrobiia bacterium]|jgi:hypothetical protein|nr:hypothetical protein [Acidimicrobiia bacterium]